MNRSIPDSRFGVGACCKLLGMLILSYVALVLVLGALLELVRSTDISIHLGDLSANDLVIAGKIAMAILTPLLMIVVTILVLKQYFPNDGLRDLLHRFGFGSVDPWWMPVPSFLIGFSMIMAVKELMKRLPPGPFLQPPSIVNLDEAVFWTKLTYAICAITLVPVAEEFVFRGVLYKGLLASTTKIIAAAAVSVIFTAGHVDMLTAGYWQNQVLLLTISVMLILARQITGSLYSPIFMHSGFNFGSVFVVVR